MSYSDSNPNWADLPRELLEVIGNHLESHVDVLRFRTVCSSWRATVSPSFRKSPRLKSLRPPHPINATAFLSPVTFYRLEQTNSERPTTWLTKLEESPKGEIQLLIPFSNRPIRYPSGLDANTKKINLLNFRLVELVKTVRLRLDRGSPVLGISKAVLFPPNCCLKAEDYEDLGSSHGGVLAIYHDGKLGYWKFGEEEWKLVDEHDFQYDDIIVYKGQVYIVDQWGKISWVDASLNLVQYSPPLYGCGQLKNLVESCGHLYVVDRYLEGRRRTPNVWEHWRLNAQKYKSKTMDVKVYRLDEEWGTWVDVGCLQDRVFVLSNECCFSVSAKEFPGCKGNCIYFVDTCDEGPYGEVSGYHARVFKLDDLCVGRVTRFFGYHLMLWPLPDWFESNQFRPLPFDASAIPPSV